MFWTKYTVIAGGPVLVVLLLGLGLRYDLFHATSWYDLFMHVLGGSVVAVSFAGAAWRLRANAAPWLITRAVPIAAVLAISILWETAEVILGMTPNWTLSVADTLSDLFFALGGAVVALCFIRVSGRDG